MPIFGKKAAEKGLEKGLDIVDKLVPDKEKKQEIASDIVNAELTSGSSFVRNARPMIIYTGLLVVLLEVFGLRLFIVDAIAEGDETILKASNAMMEYFLFTWGGVIGIYIGGRSYEKAKMRNMRRSKRG